jgi:hypothetical protein
MRPSTGPWKGEGTSRPKRRPAAVAKVIETTDGHRRYLVEIGRNEHIVFRGVIAVALGFRVRLSAVATGAVTVDAKAIRGGAKEGFSAAAAE